MNNSSAIGISKYAAVFVALPLLTIVLLISPSSAQQQMSRQDVVAAIVSAQEIFEKDCGFSIMQGRLPGDVSCGHGPETIGEAWDRSLISAGLPSGFKEREKLASDLDLDPSASLVLMGMARAEGIEYLLKKLRVAPE